MNEGKIQCAIFNDLCSSHQLVMPNFSPPDWWENDVMAVTKAGFWVEHEIKTTVADFKKDASKTKDERGVNNWRTGRLVNKHELLAARSTRGPSRFYFVVPENIEHLIVIPEWAGLKVASKTPRRVFVSTRKKAPQLHKLKIDQKIIDGAKSTCYWRMWSYKNKSLK